MDATHWQRLYERQPPTGVSWYEAVPTQSLELIRATGVPLDTPIIDVGGGASTLVDHLLEEGFTDVTVADLAPAALEQSRARLGDKARQVLWIETDITRFTPGRRYGLWHDRAVLHFLTDPSDRARYVGVLVSALAPGDFVVLATFGPEGPERCSGLPVVRYDSEGLSALLGGGFEPLRSGRQEHLTPAGRIQQFQWGLWQSGRPSGGTGRERT